MTKLQKYWANMTPEERSAEMRRRALKGKKRKQPAQKRKYTKRTATHTENQHDDALDERTIAYACGFTKANLDNYADGKGVPRSDLARAVARFLGASARG